MNVKPMEWMPAGARWPWKPCVTMKVTLGPPVREVDDEGLATMNVTVTVVGKPVHGRIGLKRWVKNRAGHLQRWRPFK